MIYNPKLEGSPFFWEGGTQGILLIHGFSATTAEVRPLARVLHASGYTVAGPLLPGHYTNPQELNHVRWQEWVTSCEEMYQRLSSHCNLVVVGGESAGGLISLYLASQHPEIAALLLYAPALRLNFKLLDPFLIHLLAPFVRWFPKKNLDSNDLWQGYTVNPLKGVLQLMTLQEKVRLFLPAITQPVLIIQGRLDTTVNSTVPDMILNRVKSTTKEMHWMEKSSHCVILDREFDQVTGKTNQFLDRVLSAKTIEEPV
jgi:carboxylesterase